MKELIAILGIFWAYLVVLGGGLVLVLVCYGALIYGAVKVIKLAWGG